ncbi:BRCA1 carboxy-terminus (BRCT) domain protein (macronuclear) [Tetrahymena thermophila SB210]|uniref:BRCA1 carboxy-terminus (BRCT) domain protein n=1 Tax=Tetrahymena thermophila (strain SB210) TaxID=312017 RepID=Q22V14_TETTS|nr:BRCA1 carboxy-terminus (BRCT) domain protein [Tetrahymena thermophila SB210]EAR89134.3 BRCA1 carboxy-terminus (BRCT) domain protein [Tetrahymena thermophila SB210]|eukprot:XP_001009379.3 BRCA1 carboxy-terminus (BRCT) domain protein [Tetrahymena thermophila SB210]
MPPKKGKKAAQSKKVEEVKPRETRLTSASKKRGSNRNSVDKIQTPNPQKQEEITAYMKDDIVKKEVNGKSLEDDQKQMEVFISPKKDVHQIGKLHFTQNSTQSKLNTPSQKITAQPNKVESKTLFTPSKVQKKIWKVSLSGFTKQLKEYNKNAIKSLNGEYYENFQPGIDVLIASKALGAKTKLSYDSGVPILNVKWLTDSIAEKCFIEDIKKYLLKPFEGCMLNILGFSQDEYQVIKQSVMDNGGDCINDLNYVQKSSDQQSSKIDMTVINSKNNSTSYLNIIKTPAVDEKWIYQCINRQMFVFPKHYVINKLDLNFNLCQEEYINKKMKESECSQKDCNYFQNCTFYIHTQFLDQQKLKIIKNLINYGGGFYINQLLPCITHIVTPQYTKQDLVEFNQFGNSIFLVHPEFLLEASFIYKKLNELDYQPQLVEQQANSQQIFSQEKVKNDTNGFSSTQQQVIQTISAIANKNRASINNPMGNMFNSQTGNGNLSRMSSFNGNGNPFQGINQQQIALANIPENEEVSEKTEQKQRKLTFKQQKQLVTVKGNLFKNCYFYLEMSQYKDKLKQYKTKIFENQGEILSFIDEKVREIFYILDDKPQSKVIMEKQFQNASFYSYRWIDFCIEKKQIVRNYQDQQLFFLAPFPHSMPLKEFVGLSVYCSGYNPNEKLALKETIKIIGAHYEFASEKRCYLITDDKECKKYRYIQDQQQHLSQEEYEIKWGKLMIVGSFWLLESVTQGKLLDHEPYKL